MIVGYERIPLDSQSSACIWQSTLAILTLLSTIYVEFNEISSYQLLTNLEWCGNLQLAQLVKINLHFTDLGYLSPIWFKLETRSAPGCIIINNPHLVSWFGLHKRMKGVWRQSEDWWLNYVLDEFIHRKWMFSFNFWKILKNILLLQMVTYFDKIN